MKLNVMKSAKVKRTTYGLKNPPFRRTSRGTVASRAPQSSASPSLGQNETRSLISHRALQTDRSSTEWIGGSERGTTKRSGTKRASGAGEVQRWSNSRHCFHFQLFFFLFFFRRDPNEDLFVDERCKAEREIDFCVNRTVVIASRSVHYNLENLSKN